MPKIFLILCAVGSAIYFIISSYKAIHGRDPEECGAVKAFFKEFVLRAVITACAGYIVPNILVSVILSLIHNWFIYAFWILGFAYVHHLNTSNANKVDPREEALNKLNQTIMQNNEYQRSSRAVNPNQSINSATQGGPSIDLSNHEHGDSEDK